jgi:hypothetical protein
MSFNGRYTVAYLHPPTSTGVATRARPAMFCMVRALVGLSSVPVGFWDKHRGVLNAEEKVQVCVRARRAQLLRLGR